MLFPTADTLADLRNMDDALRWVGGLRARAQSTAAWGWRGLVLSGCPPCCTSGADPPRRTCRPLVPPWRSGKRLTVVVNPQWQLQGQVVSDFGIGRARKAAERFVAAFEDVYYLR